MQQPQPTATDSCWKAIVADLSQRPNLREVRPAHTESPSGTDE
jgi:hypothetical protein